VRIVHLSDLHFGRHDELLAAGLVADLTSQAPNLVVISGDFTQVGSVVEFQRAREFLDSLPMPVFAVPGNHDVPARNLLRRFVNPYGDYRRYISDELEPFLELDGVAIAGLRTSRRARAELNWAHGSIGREQLRDLAGRFETSSPGAVRVVVAHHPLLQPEQSMAEPMRLVRRADLALKTFAELGVRLVLSGHFHMSYVRKHEHLGEVGVDVLKGPREAAIAPVIVAQASSTISTRLRGDRNGYNVIDIADGVITIAVREWVGEGWATREKASEPA
jgi:3',5'-cyclic AMP phosphodiesterase CpdA